MSAGGRVYLVGAGPGDPGLITRRGLELLRECDLVVLDRFIPPSLLQELKPGARRVYTGQRPGEAPPDPQEIRALIAERARAGDVVVRLESGDPFLFSAGATEAVALAGDGIAVDVVPGVPAALAAPAYAGVPLTAGETGAVTIVSARDGNVGAPSRWYELSRAATVVLLTDEVTVRPAVAAMVQEGRAPDEAAAVIEWGTTTAQRVVQGPLSEVGGRAVAAGLKGPLVAVTGPVVARREVLAWFERKPLFGVRVVVTRGRGQAGSLTALLEREGAAVVEMPVISIADPGSWKDLDQSIRLMAEGFFKWVIFTSTNAVEKLFERLAHASLDARALGRAKVAAVGAGTARVLAGHGIVADLVPEEFTGAAVVAALGRGSGRILLPRVQGAPGEIVESLTAAGWSVREVTAYRNLPAGKDSLGAAVVASGRFDVVTFTSASTVRNFLAVAGAPEDLGLTPGGSGRGVACIGPVTAAAAEGAGLRVDVVAEEHSTTGLVDALVARFGRR
ncbi:MAG: uroporphyrinogen-III synthase [Actinomycetota bacterium]|nr:uroporphyrinogen-III synthase [Actinomycetota bacterium]